MSSAGYSNAGRVTLTPYKCNGLAVGIMAGEDGLGEPLYQEVHICPAPPGSNFKNGGIVGAKPRVFYRTIAEARHALDAIYNTKVSP